MALATNAAATAAMSGAAASQQPRPHAPAFLPLRRRCAVRAVHAAEPSKSHSIPAAAKTSSPTVAPEKEVGPVASPAPAPKAPAKWAVDSWTTKKALQLPEYPNPAELEVVLKTIEAFPPIVFAGEARHLEERLADAAMGRAFLLQGGDCAESFKEFNSNNIRDTFRVILQMSAVLMFGAQMPVIKVPTIAIPIYISIRERGKKI
jgi:3-deoxy-7-phosphoheptulonate synthase